MQNVQNAAEIQKRVINLVELYRTKVGKESQAAKNLAEEYKHQYDNEIDIAYSLHEQGIEGYVLDIDIPEDAVDAIRANEQLLGYFYQKVAQENADKDVLACFLADKYDSSVYNEEDEAFLACHFAEMVNYIIQTPNNNLSAVDGNDRNDLYLLPTEVLNLIKERVAIPSDSKIYIPFTGFAQLACLYKDCSFLCEESYKSYYKMWNIYCDEVREAEHIVENKVDENKLSAWMRIALFANNLDATVLDDNTIPQRYNAVLAYIPYIPSDIPTNSQVRTGYELSDATMIEKISLSYQNLTEGGKMVLVLPTEYLWKREVLPSEGKTLYALELGALWKQMIDDKSLVEIIQLPSVMGKSFYDKEHSIIIAEKGRHDDIISFTDARFASRKSDGELFKQILDVNALQSMVENEGMDPNTGLRKCVRVRTEQVDSDLIVPQVYVIEKPAEHESPVPLTDFCSLVTSHIYDVQENLPEDTPWVKTSDLSDSFLGTLDIATLQVVGCPNNPEGWSYGNRKLSNFLMGKNGYSERDIRISHYRNCKYIDGKSNAVLFKLSNDGINVAVLEATGKVVAVSADIHILLPKTKMDVLTLTALLRTPMIYRQLKEYEKFGLYGFYGHLKDVLVPTNKRIIGDERRRLLQELKTLKEKDEELAAQKAEYINEVRMRKHDMGQYIFELVNIEDLMRYYIENRDSEKGFCQEIEKLLDNFKSSLGELSTLLANLSKEEQFGKPEELEEFHIDNYLSQLANRHKADGFKIIYERDIESIKRYNKLKKDIDDSLSIDDIQDMDDSLSIDDIQDMDDSLSIDDVQDMDDSLSIDDIQDMDDSLPIDDIQDMDESSAVDNLIVLENNVVKSISDSIPKMNIAKNDIQRAVNNIIDNARKHGFGGVKNSNNEIRIKLAIDTEKNMFQIDFRNNGKPLPDGMDKMRYGLKGEKAGETGGTGIGGNYVKAFVENYGGDYDVFMEGGWTVVRIYLPIK